MAGCFGCYGAAEEITFRSSTMGVPSTSLRRRIRGTVQGRGKSHVQTMVTRKLKKLKKIIPGCQEVKLEELLQRTAEYIAFLELQVLVLRRISKLPVSEVYLKSHQFRLSKKAAERCMPLSNQRGGTRSNY
ncbi:hypothetical protein MUK42_00522 [Musa troglodytarum]|uniref:BHLH domain-containing protein n=1 Tax=Musa troglodytarum TaxID=320322 RepID=A0A9E7FCT0_9LILI|nr:hypothetical protein MUK42_00522 [Musa troglodytarum]